MKKYFLYIMAVALCGMMAFTSCSKDDDSSSSNTEAPARNNDQTPDNGNGGDNGNNNGSNSDNGNGGDNTDISTGDYVDLGLPSGTLWAKRNVGADSVEDYGEYYSWAEVETKDIYDWDHYRYRPVGNNGFGLDKYCSRGDWGLDGFTDNLTTLQSDDDAATAIWGSAWRTPTADEWAELIDKCSWTWYTYKSTDGYLVTGPNGHSIFLPAAGARLSDYLHDAGKVGNYWASSLYTSDPYRAWSIRFEATEFYRNDDRRSDGFTVRPVRR